MYGKQGIRCVAICPGGVKTNIGAGGMPSQLGCSVPGPGFGTMPRAGEPEELANAIL